MSNYELKFILLPFVIGFGIGAPSKRKKTENTQKFHNRTGEAIADNELIRKYEKEHQQFHYQESKNGCLEWIYLDNKNLTTYCRKYIQHSTPTRTNEDASGIKIKATLHYEKENTFISNEIVVLRCKVKNKKDQKTYNLTRAHKINCVYALKCSRKLARFTFTIINKYCDFEGRVLINNSLKCKKLDLVKKIHNSTGQPIAKKEYLEEYEMEHQNLFRREVENGELLEWPHAMEHPNLNSFCYQYIGACAPRRYIGNTRGCWNTQKLHYQYSITNNNISVTTVRCLLADSWNRSYYISRANESNCVYALLRQGHNVNHPFVIVFKHCDFEFASEQKVTSTDHNTVGIDIFSKTEVKEEMLDTLEVLNFFPQD